MSLQLFLIKQCVKVYNNFVNNMLLVKLQRLYMLLVWEVWGHRGTLCVVHI